ncbi:MAG: ABC transporter ATP-binding protein [Acetobacteraceae bacterium]
MPGPESSAEARDAVALLEAVSLTRHFRIGGLFGRTLHAVDDVDLALHEREIVALVGESGSGKSTVARLFAMVFRPTAGEIRFCGRLLREIRSRRDALAYRGQVRMVLQDPFSSLNPVHTVGYTLERVLKLHRPSLSRAEQEMEAGRALDSVGLAPGMQMLARYPHELSGGQRQRVAFARALSCRPKAILADEPVSMLDVSIRIGLLNLMTQLCEDSGLSFLYITHDIASARYVAHRVVVMYAGQVVESGPTEEVLQHPLHPYTRLLLSAVPDPRAAPDTVTADAGEPPRVVDPGEGCRFRWRCPIAIARCAEVTPKRRFAAPGHDAACHVTVGLP